MNDDFGDAADRAYESWIDEQAMRHAESAVADMEAAIEAAWRKWMEELLGE